MTPLTSGRASARPTAPEPPETLESLLGDCRRMAAQWTTGPTGSAGSAGTAGTAVRAQAPSTPVVPHGITVPAASARAVRAMPDYGA